MSEENKEKTDIRHEDEGKPEPRTGRDQFFDMYHFQNRWDAILAGAVIVGILFVIVLYFLFSSPPPA